MTCQDTFSHHHCNVANCIVVKQKALGFPSALLLATCLFVVFATIFLLFAAVLFPLAAIFLFLVIFNLDNLHIATTFFFLCK